MLRRLLIASQPLDAGVPRHVLDLVSRLDPAEYEADVVCPRASTLWRGLEGSTGVRLHEMTPRRGPSPADAISLVRLVRLARGADVVHGHSSKAGFLVRLASLLAGRRERCVFTPHAWSFWAGRGSSARLYLMLERLAARWCRTIIALSESEKGAGLALGVGQPTQYRVVVNGVALERFRLPAQPIEGRILGLGRLAAQKRPDLAVRVLARVRELHPDAELHLAGEGPARAEVERLVSALELDTAVRLLGPQDDVPGLLAETFCLLLTSDYESSPYTVIEAMAAGVPVVATRVGGVPELVRHGETGLLADRGDVNGLAEALGELLADPDRARRMGAAGREVARELFSLDRMVARTLAIYDEVSSS